MKIGALASDYQETLYFVTDIRKCKCIYIDLVLSLHNGVQRRRHMALDRVG
jgi:hypothetical protein